MELILRALAEGSIWTVMGLGIYITFRILKAPDLTAEGSFTLGAAIGSQLVVLGVHPILALIVAFFCGMAAGAITGLLTTRLDIDPLLSGIITMTGLYSVNLKLMGRANLSLNNQYTLKSMLGGLHLPRYLDTLLIGLVITAIVILLLSLFFKTEMGQALIATGDNPTMASSLGIQTDEMTMLGYMLGNGLVATSGYLVATDNGYADMTMGTGTVVIGLAAVIIGEVVIRNVSLPVRLCSIFVGSSIYRFLLMLVLKLNFDPNDFKLFSAIVLGICLAIPNLQKKYRQRQVQAKRKEKIS